MDQSPVGRISRARARRAGPLAVAGVPEVGGSVDGGEPVPADVAQGEGGAELDGAVAAEDEGELPGPCMSFDAVGEGAGVPGDGGGVDHPVALLPVARVVAHSPQAASPTARGSRPARSGPAVTSPGGGRGSRRSRAR